MDTMLYDDLEVHPNASSGVIQAAYKALMKAHHPDVKDTVLGTKAKAITAAYAVLSDPVQRAAYDQKRLNLQGVIVGGCRIDAPIAEGGFGKTYRGTHLLTGMPVCVKHCSRISPADATILIEETKAMWDLRHYALPAARNLVKLDDGSLALVMSYIEGPTFEKVIQTCAARRARLEPEHVAWVASRVLNALSYMHRHGVVHGDLKPGNIILKPEEHAAFVVDFGLSAVKPSKTVGSKGYTSVFSPPEQVKGAPLLPQTDFYALGMTMLYALTGDLARAEQHEVPTGVPDPLCKFVRRLLVRDPLSRPDWRNEDLIATFDGVRKASFGRVQSNLIPLTL